MRALKRRGSTMVTRPYTPRRPRGAAVRCLHAAGLCYIARALGQGGEIGRRARLRIANTPLSSRCFLLHDSERFQREEPSLQHIATPSRMVSKIGIVLAQILAHRRARLDPARTQSLLRPSTVGLGYAIKLYREHPRNRTYFDGRALPPFLMQNRCITGDAAPFRSKDDVVQAHHTLMLGSRVR